MSRALPNLPRLVAVTLCLGTSALALTACQSPSKSVPDAAASLARAARSDQLAELSIEGTPAKASGSRGRSSRTAGSCSTS